MTEDKKPVGKETIYVDVEDEITSIIDKVEGAKQKVVALVLPKRAATLQSIVNMRLLKRSADDAGKNVVLITGEAALLPLAGAAGIHVAKSLTSKPEIPPAPNMPDLPTKSEKEIAQPPAGEVDEEALPKKINYDKSIGELAAAHDLENPDTIELGDEPDAVATAAASTEKLPKAPKDRALKVPNFDRFRLWLALGIAGFIAFIVFIFLAIFVLPKATIAIQTSSTPVSANLTYTASTTASSLDEDKKIIPAILKNQDQNTSEQVTASGQQNNGDKATGSATLVNCNNGAVTVPAGTGISANGLTFITQKSVALDPGNFDSHGNCKTTGSQASSGSTNITAQTGGSKYNTSLSGASVAGYSDVTASGSASGGTDNIQTVVSQSDVDNAKQKATASTNSDSFTKNMENQLSQQGYYVLTSTLKASDPTTTASPDVGQPASTVTVNVKVTYSVLAVKQADLKQAISDALAGQIDKTKQKLDDSQILSDANIDVTSQSDTGATLDITENTSAVPILDTNSIKTQAQGKKSAEITSSIGAIPGVKSVNVRFRPFWVSKAPKASKITVTVQHVANSGNGG